LNGRKSIQVRAQMLRDKDAAPNIWMTAGCAAAASDDKRVRASGQWRQADVKRAIAAAEQAELKSYRIEIDPDGTISIIVGAPLETARPDFVDDLLRP